MSDDLKERLRLWSRDPSVRDATHDCHEYTDAGERDQDQARFERAQTQLVYSLADHFSLEITDAQARSIAREVLQAADASDHEPHHPTAGEQAQGRATTTWASAEDFDHIAGEQDTNKKGPANA